MNRKIHIKFECDQDWEQMKISGEGRYCKLCSKTVRDFTGKSENEIVRSSNGDLCGMFLAEQIDSNLTPIEFTSKLRTAFLTIGTLVGLEVSHVQAKHLPSRSEIENSISTITQGDTSIVKQQEKKVESSKVESNDFEKVKRPIRTKYFFSKRFPFIVKRKIRTLGRYRI